MKMNRLVGLSLLLDVAVVLALFLGRNNILHWILEREQQHLKSAYHVTLSVQSIRFTSWNRIGLTGISVQPEGGDTLARIRRLEFKPDLWGMLTRRKVFSELAIDSAVITAYNESDSSNLAFLKSEIREQKATPKKSNYYARVGSWKDRFLEMLHTPFEIISLQINYRDTSANEQVNVPHLAYDGHTLSGLLINQLLGDTVTMSAEVIKADEVFKINLRHLGNALSYLPFLDAEHGLKCRFDSVDAMVNLEEADNGIQISPEMEFHNFHLQHWRLAKEDVVLPDAKFKGRFEIKRDYLELDSTSTVTFNHTSFKVFASYQVKPDTIFAMGIHMPETVSDTFFNALPGGMFNTLKGISCSGTLAYDLQFSINARQPDSLIFESQLKRKNFHINHFGADDYTRINNPFVYDAFSGSQFIRHIMVGLENPDFTPYGRISPYVAAAIWQSEDPSFMVHRGFVSESFRESIAQNFKEKRFARGGSTITMQLVKNVFLSRNKTISRKAEEALIVYLIENLGLVPKERMMEVYLNVIEWGPNVYGVAEAARFYFNEKPSELTLQQSIFLAAIIPNPRYFKYQFDKQGEIKPYMADFFKIIEGRMMMRGYLTGRDTVNFIPRVKLSGPALQMVAPVDTIVPFMDENE